MWTDHCCRRNSADANENGTTVRDKVARLRRIANEYTYTGRRFDDETGLYYYRNRYYDSQLGRFVSRDPIGHVGSKFNLYCYVRGMPLQLTDPLGLIDVQSVVSTGVAIVRSCDLETLLDLVDLAAEYLDALQSLPFVFPLHPNNPHQHCVWNCHMTRWVGEDFAEDMSGEKEEIDEAFADLGVGMSEECWNALPESVRDYIAASACSANQPSDFEDNATGRSCGERCNRHMTCEECCTSKGIGPKTPEGDEEGSTRPYGPECNDRFRGELPG